MKKMVHEREERLRENQSGLDGSEMKIFWPKAEEELVGQRKYSQLLSGHPGTCRRNGHRKR